MIFFNKDIFKIRYLEAALRGLEAARIKTGLGKGLFAATAFDPAKCKTEVTSGDSQVNDDNYSLAWIRDTLKCSAYDLVAGNTARSQHTMATLLTYFRKNIETIDQTLEASSKGEKLECDRHAILPRMHPLTLEPVHADQKKDLQLDMAEFLKHLALLTENGICVLQDREDIRLVKKILDYFLAWDYSRNSKIPGDFGIWEEGKGGTRGDIEPDIHASSIAAILSGYMHVQGLTLRAKDGTTESISIDERTISSGFEFLNERMSSMGETEERPYDLTGLMILYDHFILQEKKKGELLTEKNVWKIRENYSQLERDRGFVRYASEENPDTLDDYHKSGSPKGKSAEWTMGFGYGALIAEKLGLYDEMVEYIEKMEAVFDWDKELGLPEAYFGGTDRPVPISPLSWSNALYLMAYETIRKV
ncbi:MAG: hypothetical protein AB4290_09920 [Spirulina sp.]